MTNKVCVDPHDLYIMLTKTGRLSSTVLQAEKNLVEALNGLDGNSFGMGSLCRRFHLPEPEGGREQREKDSDSSQALS